MSLTIHFPTGIVPDKIKIAKVFPIFKNGLESNVSNYRPISLLPVFNIVLEKLMYIRLIQFIEKRNLIYDKQFGFQSHHSTEHTMLSTVDKIHEAIEKGEFSCGVFLDLTKSITIYF